MRNFALAAACAATMLSGAAQAQNPAQAPAQTLRIALREDPDIMDPTLARTYVGRIVFAGLCDKLFDINDKLEIVPQLALSYEWTDPTSLVIKLRPGVVFHDGEKLDAAAVKYSLERHLNMVGSFRRSEIGVMDRVEAVDPLTIKIVLKTASSPFVSQLTDRAGMIVSPKAAEAAGKDFGLKPVCAGPFRFVERVAQEKIVLERFADYWDKDRIHIDRVTYFSMPDSTVRLANLRSGSLDLMERLLATDIATVRGDPKLKLLVGPSLMYTGLTINLANTDQAKNPLGQNAKVRQALELTIDRDALNKVVFNGEFVPGNQWSSPANPYYIEKFPIPSRNVEKAKALIKEAGVTTPITLDMMVPNQPDLRQVAEIIQAMAAEGGFDLKVRLTEFATSLAESVKGNFQIYLIGWSGRIDPDQNVINHLGCGAAPFNWGKYCNGTAQAGLDEARTVIEPAKRKAAYEKAFAQIEADMPLIYLYHQHWVFAYSAKIEGYKQPPDGIIRPQDIKLAR
jgi:peptide/nickel transport system substrate-binding protein